MYEKVNPSHPDKVADRIAGAIVDLAYTKSKNPKVAVEVLLGHEHCTVIVESSENFLIAEIQSIVDRIVGTATYLACILVPQDPYLANNQKTLRCGDNGIFKGCPVTKEQGELSAIARRIYERFPTDGKYLVADQEVTICQSQSDWETMKTLCPNISVYNPLGPWTGGPNVDSGATNRKLGSDMGDAVTGGGIHGKDLSKADVTINIYLHCMAQMLGTEVEACCSIGDEDFEVYRNGVLWGVEKFSAAVEVAKRYIENLGGFEKLAEWGLI